MSDWAPPLMALLALQRRLERGPKREGAFALWLTVRLALEIGAGSPATERADRRRVALLSRRVSQLVVPKSLARGLVATLDHLASATPEAASVALAQLVAPARDALGDDAANAVEEAWRGLREGGKEGKRE